MDGGEKRQWCVEGMDCAACVAKVTKAVERLPGVSAVSVNLMAKRLTATVESGAVAGELVAEQVTDLGYTVSPLAGAGRPTPPPDLAPPHHHDHAGHGHDEDRGSPTFAAPRHDDSARATASAGV